MSFTRPTAFARDLAITGATSLLTVVAFVAATKLLTTALAPDEFGAYSLARRLLATVEPATTAGMSVALTRFLAATRGEGLEKDWTLAAAALAGSVTLAVALLSTFAPANWFFGAEGYRTTQLATTLFIFSYTAYALWYAYLRGTNSALRANLWQAGVVAGSPLVAAAILAPWGRADFVITAIGLAHLVAVVGLAKCLWPSRVNRAILSRARELCAFALPRIPGTLAYGGVFAVGPLLAAHFGGLSDAANIAIAQSVLRILEGGTDGFGRVALPFFASLQATGQTAYVRLQVQNVVVFVIQNGVFLTSQVWIWCGQLIPLWVGPDYPEAVPATQVLSIAITPFILFTVLRPVMDAVETRAVAARASLVSLGVTSLASYWLIQAGNGALGLAAGMATGLFTLGLLTFGHLWRRLRLDVTGILQAGPLVSAVLLAILGDRAATFAAAIPASLRGLYILVAIAVIGSCYAVAIWKLKPSWIPEVSQPGTRR